MTTADDPAGHMIVRAARIHGPRDLRLVDVALPPLGAGEVRVGLRAGGICGSDMHYFTDGRNGDFEVLEPLTLGHEVAGIAVAVGAEVTGVAPGDPVAVNPARWCGRCADCRRGDINLCRNNFFMGSASRRPHMHGGFASHFDVAARQCIVVPADIPLEQIALAEPLAVCLHAVARAGAVTGSDVAVTGGGPIGLLTALAARHRGARRVTVVDIAAQPLKVAAGLGFETIAMTGAPAPELAERFDTIFEASGAAPALANALTLVRRGGTLVQIGNYAVPVLNVPSNIVMAKEIAWRGSFRFGDEFAEAVRLIVEGALEVAPLISARIELAEVGAAFALALDRSRSVKVIITHTERQGAGR